MGNDQPRLSRRRVLQATGGASVLALLGSSDAPAQTGDELPAPIRALKPLEGEPPPIGLDEHRGRLARAQALLAANGLDAIVVGPGSSLRYFTGAEWGLSERFFGFVLGRGGDPVWVVPAFERDRGLEQIRIGGDVRAWQEDESPHALVARSLRDLGAGGRVGFEETLPFAFSDGIAQAAPGLRFASATPVSAGCRMVKDAHELALMRRAAELTLRAHRVVFESLSEGLAAAEAWRAGSVAAHRRLGVPRRLARAVRARRGLPARHREAADALRGGTWC